VPTANAIVFQETCQLDQKTGVAEAFCRSTPSTPVELASRRSKQGIPLLDCDRWVRSGTEGASSFKLSIRQLQSSRRYVPARCRSRQAPSRLWSPCRNRIDRRIDCGFTRS
jgi:hypothetical protein